MALILYESPTINGIMDAATGEKICSKSFQPYTSTATIARQRLRLLELVNQSAEIETLRALCREAAADQDRYIAMDYRSLRLRDRLRAAGGQ
jgi:hypothetical protein